MPAKGKSVRMNFRMSQQTKERLVRLQVETGTTMTDVVRRALALYDMALENERAGGETLLVSREGKERRILFDH